MKVLVASSRSQGARDDDFQGRGSIDGELVWLPQTCSTALDPDSASHCSCMTEFVGVESDRPTTTAEVRDLPIERRAYLDALEAGHLTCCHGLTGIRKHGKELLRIAARLRTGIVVERWGEWVGLRFDADTGALQPPMRLVTEFVEDSQTMI